MDAQSPTRLIDLGTSDVPAISPEHAYALLNRFPGPQLLDIRREEAFAKANHSLPGALRRDPDARMGWLILVGTLPIAALGLLFKDAIETSLRHLAITATMLIVFGLLLGWADRRAPQTRTLRELGWGHGLVFGFAQAMHLTEASPLMTEDNRHRLWREWSKHWDLDRSYLVEKSPPNLIKGRFLQAMFPRSGDEPSSPSHLWGGARGGG